MNERVLVGFAAVLAMGIGAQWLAWRIKQPSILLLLVTGFLAGPVLGLLDPDALLGQNLMPLVSLSVAVILFEGGLSMDLREIRGLGGVMLRLIVVGALGTILIVVLAGQAFLGLDAGLAALLGAVLCVSGPTVIMPLLRHVRPSRQVASVLKWEAMLIDAVGATLALVIFEFLRAESLAQGAQQLALGIVLTLVVGAAVGALAAVLLLLLLRRDCIPQYLQSPATLALVIGAFTAANVLQHESGLLSVILMGAMLANQGEVTVRHVAEFKENLGVVLLASLFILLAARLTPADIAQVGFGSIPFLLVLFLVGRPAVVLLATWRSALSWRERVYVGCMHPRGVVAAAVSAVFALRLAEDGRAGAEVLVPLTFLVITASIVVYGLPAGLLARLLGIARKDPQGLLIVGAAPWVRATAKLLESEGVTTVLVDSNRRAIADARLEGLVAWHGDATAEDVLPEEDLAGVGRLLAVTPNDEVNSLAALHHADEFGRDGVFQLAPGGKQDGPRPRHLRGRLLFGSEASHEKLTALWDSGARVKATPLTAEFSWEDWRAMHGAGAVPLFVLGGGGSVRPFTARNPPQPAAGQVLIALVPAATPGACREPTDRVAAEALALE